jgi:hypothetical protein
MTTPPLGPTTHAEATVETPALGIETGPSSSRNTPPILNESLPPDTTGPTPPDSALAETPYLTDGRPSPRMRFRDMTPITEIDAVKSSGAESPDVFQDQPQTVEVTVEDTDGSRSATIAERRAANAPPNVVPPLRATLAGRFRKSAPLTESVASALDSPRTEASFAEIPEISDKQRQINMAVAIKSAQKEDQNRVYMVREQYNQILSENHRTAPRKDKARDSGKVKTSGIEEISNDLDRRYRSAHDDRLAGAMQQAWLSRRKQARKRRLVAKAHQDMWEEYHRILVDQMANRAQLPTEIYECQPSYNPEFGGTNNAQEESQARGRNTRMGTEHQVEMLLARTSIEAMHDPIGLADKNGIEIPDLLPKQERLFLYDDENDLVDDPLEFYDFAGRQEPLWTEKEKHIFKKVFPNCGKVFSKIADKLPNKTVNDCVLYYYRNKKALNLKRDQPKGAAPRKAVKPKAKKLADPLKVDDDPSPPAGGSTPIVPRGIGAGRGGKGGRGRGTGASTPAGSNQGRRKGPAMDAVVAEGQSSENTSRAPSETPGAAVKVKGRSGPKPKRPRESSISNAIAGPSVIPPIDGDGGDTPTIEETHTELLPPVKRGGKRRKVGPDGQVIEVGEKGEKRKRPGPSSYWNAEEKLAVHRLAAMYPDDVERVARELPGQSKTPKQVSNFLKSARIGVDDNKILGPVSVLLALGAKLTGSRMSVLVPWTTTRIVCLLAWVLFPPTRRLHLQKRRIDPAVCRSLRC